MNDWKRNGQKFQTPVFLCIRPCSIRLSRRLYDNLKTVADTAPAHKLFPWSTESNVSLSECDNLYVSSFHTKRFNLACWLEVDRYHFWIASIFSRGHATQHLAVSVGRLVGMSVGMSVRPSHFWIPSGYRITAPAQPSTTGLPCIRPCFFRNMVIYRSPNFAIRL